MLATFCASTSDDQIIVQMDREKFDQIFKEGGQRCRVGQELTTWDHVLVAHENKLRLAEITKALSVLKVA